MKDSFYKEALQILLASVPINIFRNYPFIKEMYLCGGTLRDLFISGNTGKDLDIFLNCSHKELHLFLEYLKQFGTISWGPYGSPRFYFHQIENYYVDIVPFYNFIVSENGITSIHELLQNFDITVNALAVNIKTYEFINPLGALDDIKHKILRAVRLDFPEKDVSAMIHLSAVSVFWFRLLYYQEKLGFQFDDRTKQWVIANKQRIKDRDLFEHYFFEVNVPEDILCKRS